MYVHCNVLGIDPQLHRFHMKKYLELNRNEIFGIAHH